MIEVKVLRIFPRQYVAGADGGYMSNPVPLNEAAKGHNFQPEHSVIRAILSGDEEGFWRAGSNRCG
ncbi:MAG: hypothetical protein L3J36_15830 [Rhodobacteraceae bacterium]|nr:hypothetical protein [Paracoccaceae bacterium]